MHKQDDTLKYFAADPEASLCFGAHLAQVFVAGMVIYLEGPLGAGKTSLVRGMLRGLGFTGLVKSPTYTLVESYELAELSLYHFDFYRINTAIETEAMGLRDYFTEQSIVLLEWPERVAGMLPAADWRICLSIVPKGRYLTLYAETELGYQCLHRLTPPEAME